MASKRRLNAGRSRSGHVICMRVAKCKEEGEEMVARIKDQGSGKMEIGDEIKNFV